MSSKLQLDVVTTVRGGAIWWMRTNAKGRHGVVCRLNCVIHVWAPWGRDTCHLGRYINLGTLPLYMPAVNAAIGQVLSTRSPVDHGHCPASCDTALVASGDVDCGRRRRNIYDKKAQRYAKDNRTAHLTARSDKSVAYVTNNKRLYSTFCTIKANYWQTRSIARPLCDSRATCIIRTLHSVHR